MIEEVEEMAEAPAIEVKETIQETTEEREARLKREDYARRDAEQWADRERIYRENGLLKEDESLSRDPEAALRGRCCP